MKPKLCIALVLGLLAGTLGAQERADFSGRWLLLPDEGVRPNRSGAPARGRRGASGLTGVAGAAINCGTECTITQSSTRLTISRPDGGGRPSEVVLVLDEDADRSGDPSAVVRWVGGSLVVTRTIAGTLTVTQTLSVDQGRLTIVSQFSAGFTEPVALTYARK